MFAIMLKLDNNTKVWVTSDTHYNHKNICRGVSDWITAVEKEYNEGKLTKKEFDEKMKSLQKQTRNFNTLEEMNSAIVNNINGVVGQDDVLIHFGDWSFGGFENIEQFYNRLVCKNIHLILGNHDHHIENDRGGVASLFLSVNDFLRVQYKGETFECMHYPITSWNTLRRGRIHLHGHTHLPDHKKISGGRRIDVGMDGHPEFRPYDLELEIIPMMRKIPVGSEMGADDHHTDDKKIVG